MSPRGPPSGRSWCLSLLERQSWLRHRDTSHTKSLSRLLINSRAFPWESALFEEQQLQAILAPSFLLCSCRLSRIWKREQLALERGNDRLPMAAATALPLSHQGPSHKGRGGPDPPCAPSPSASTGSLPLACSS